MKKYLPWLFLALSVSCTSGGGVEPIVIDLSKPNMKTPSVTHTPTPAATSVAAPAATPEPKADGVAPTAALSLADPARTVDARIDAFNRRDAPALVELYAPDARIYDPPDRVRDAGIDGIRAALERELAAASGGPVAVRDRIIQGAFVVERETRGGASALVIYEVRGGRIANVWIMR